jgi:hypothetical protein
VPSVFGLGGVNVKGPPGTTQSEVWRGAGKRIKGPNQQKRKKKRQRPTAIDAVVVPDTVSDFLFGCALFFLRPAVHALGFEFCFYFVWSFSLSSSRCAVHAFVFEPSAA